AGNVLADLAHTRGLLELTGRLLKTQVELLLLQIGELVLELVGREAANFFGFHGAYSLLCDALNEARLHRELGGAETKRLTGDLLRHTVDLEHHTTGLDLACPVFDRALALTHTDFGGLRRDRNIGEYPDPDATGALHMAGDRAAGRLDLARVDAVRFLGLQAEFAECQVETALGHTLDASLELLAELRTLWLQHFLTSPSLSFASVDQAFSRSRRRSPR